VDLRREEDQIAWLRRKGEQGGFEVMGVRVQGVEKEEGQRRGGGRRGSGLTLAAVIFEGHLRITAAEKFYEVSLARGIGPGKAYGMGLLSLAPVNGKR
jgi:CRISPR system Cascade subunit CasE